MTTASSLIGIARASSGRAIRTASLRCTAPLDLIALLKEPE